MFSLFEIAFYVVALCIIVFSVLAVTTNSILRSATYLLFVLLATGGIYAILGYTFLSAVQLMVYAGGIIVLYVFSILLTRSSGTHYRHKRIRPEHHPSGSGAAGEEYRRGAYRNREISVRTAFRGYERAAAGLYDRRNHDCQKKKMMKK